MISLLSELLDATLWPRLLLDASLKSACVLLAALLLSGALSRASAAARSLLWSVALGGALLLPPLALALPSWSLPMLPALPGAWLTTQAGQAKATVVTGDNAVAEGKQPESGSLTITHQGVNNYSVVGSPPASAQDELLPASAVVRPGFDWGLALLLIWLGGWLAVLVRLAAGTVGIWWLTRGAERVTDASAVELTGRLAAALRVRGRVELFRSQHILLPMTWGWRRAAILLPMNFDRWSDDCRRIVLLHELTHVKRRDCLLQTLAQLACALYWFNPLVWLAAKRLRVERELACDDGVLATGTKASDYAGLLVEVARTLDPTRALSPVAVGIACSQLESRVRAILSPRRRAPVSRLSVALTSGLAVCLVAPLAMIHPAPGATVAATSELASAAPAAFAQHNEKVSTSPIARKDAVIPPTAQPSAVQSSVPRDEQEAGQGDGLGAGQGAGLGVGLGAGTGVGAGQGVGQGRPTGDWTVEQLIEMKAVGVTPEYIESLRKLGYDKLTPQQLTELSALGVNEDYIKQARAWRGGNLTIRELVELKAVGLNGDYISQMKSAGYNALTTSQLTQMRALGVTPEYVAAMRQLGFGNLSAEQLISLRALGVSESFVREAQGWGFGDLSIEDLTQIRALGVSQEYIRAMKALGFDNLSLKKLIEMRALGVSENFIREMRQLGFDNLSLEQLIEMKAVGVTPDYVRKLRAAGLKNVSVNQMIEMRATGVDNILLKGNRN